MEIDDLIGNQFYLAQLLSHAIAMTNVIWNPILYFWMSKAHRTALIQKLSLVSENPVARMSVFLRRGSQAVDSTPAGSTLSHEENPGHIIRLSPHNSVSGHDKSHDHVVAARRCSFDPFMDMNLDNVEELKNRRKKFKESKVKVQRTKDRCILSTRLPDIVISCTEDE